MAAPTDSIEKRLFWQTANAAGFTGGIFTEDPQGKRGNGASPIRKTEANLD